MDLSPGLLAMRLNGIRGAFLRQPLSLWALCAYLFFEYVRPQSIYTQLAVLPFSKLSLLAASLFALTELGRRRWTLLDTGVALYTIVLLASLATAFDPASGMKRLSLYFDWVLVFWCLSTAVNTPTKITLMLLTWFLWNLKMSLFAVRSWASFGFGFRDWGVGGAPGWFQNSGEFGIQMCVIVPISLCFAFGVRRYVRPWTFAALLLLPATAVLGTIASSSRGALLGMAAIGLWMMARSRYKLRSAIGLAVAVPLLWVLVPEEQKARFDSVGEDGSSVNRLTYWTRGLEFANENPILGIGYGNWMSYYTYRWGDELNKGERVQVSHNIFIECMSELGYSGLAALLLLMGGTFALNARTRRRARQLGPSGELMVQLAWGFDGALIGFVVSGFFVTVLYYPYLWVNLGMTAALHLAVQRQHRAASMIAGPQLGGIRSPLTQDLRTVPNVP